MPAIFALDLLYCLYSNVPFHMPVSYFQRSSGLGVVPYRLFWPLCGGLMQHIIAAQIITRPLYISTDTPH